MIGTTPPFFFDRTEAGRRLAVALEPLRQDHPVILALPRGGAPVGREVALRLGARLGLLLVRKIGLPDAPELAMGAAVASAVVGAAPEIVLNDDVIRNAGVTPAALAQARDRAIGELARRQRLYGPAAVPPPVEGRCVVLVDDGIATGATMQAAVTGLGRRAPARIVVAVPVAPPEAVARLGAMGVEVVCLQTPVRFEAVGEFYERFDQVQDRAVLACLEAADAAQRAAEAETARRVGPDAG